MCVITVGWCEAADTHVGTVGLSSGAAAYLSAHCNVLVFLTAELNRVTHDQILEAMCKGLLDGQAREWAC